MRSTAPVSSLGPKVEIGQHVIDPKNTQKQKKGTMLKPNRSKCQETQWKGEK